MPAPVKTLSNRTETALSTENRTGIFIPRPFKSINPVKFPSGTNAFAVPFKLFRKASVSSASSTPSVYVESAVSAPSFSQTVCGRYSGTVFTMHPCACAVSAAVRSSAFIAGSRSSANTKAKTSSKNANTRRLRPRLYRLRRYRYINHQSFPIRQYTPKRTDRACLIFCLPLKAFSLPASRAPQADRKCCYSRPQYSLRTAPPGPECRSRRPCPSARRSARKPRFRFLSGDRTLPSSPD